jgi:hypothetical protein
MTRQFFGTKTLAVKERTIMDKAIPKSDSGKSPEPVAATSTSYRPTDYFGRYDLQTELLTQVKGTARRKALRKALDEGQILQVPDAIKNAALSEAARQYVGSLHPSYMGGEYLPTVDMAEVEIARIRINSTTGDVTSVYARPAGQRIAYRVVDEYQGDTLSDPKRRTSIKPLTMGQLIDFFLGAWDLYACLDGNFEGDLKEMLGFFEGESEFYPHFDSELRRLVREKFPPMADEYDDDEE